MTTKRPGHEHALSDTHRRAQSGPDASRRSSRKHGSSQSLRERLREDPKGVLESELTIVLVGVVIAFFGSLLTAGGWYASYSGKGYTFAGTRSAAPEPILGVIVFFVGACILSLGLVLALLSIGIYLRAKLHRRKSSLSP